MSHLSRRLRAALFLAGLLGAAAGAHAQTTGTQTEAPAWSFNAGVVSDYRYRGISQTALRPALQAGADLALPGGWYAGGWASTLRWIADSAPGLRGPLEIDLYAGRRTTVGPLGLDLGVLQYWYPGANLQRLSGERADTTEVYGGVSAGPVTVKVSHSLTPLFGTPNSRGSGYLDLTATLPLADGWSLAPHLGAQRIAGLGTYRDWSLTLLRELGSGWSASAAVVGTTWNDRFGAPYLLPGSGGRDLGRTGLVVGLKATL